MKTDRLYLEHILEAIQNIQEYTADDVDVFMRGKMVRDAVMRNFEIIGEAAKRLSDEIKANRSDIPWRDIAGLRDILIHNYMGVNLKRIWNVVKNDLPPLHEAVVELLRLC